MLTDEVTAPAPAADEFLELESKIERVAGALRDARAERDRAEARLAQVEAALEKLRQEHAARESEMAALRQQRNEVRTRVARLVKQLEAAG